MANIQRTELMKSKLVARKKQIDSLFGDKEKSNKFLATAVEVASNFKLSECHPDSIIDACVNIAQMNLDISQSMQQVYIVPFKKSVQVIISSRGYVALLARTGWSVKSYIVNESDAFNYSINGFDESVTFEKNLDDDNPVFKYAVAIAKNPNGEIFVEVMNKSMIEKRRLVSSNQGQKASGVWLEWYNEMATKTVVKSLIKRLPIGEEIQKATFLDDTVIEAEVVQKNTSNYTQNDEYFDLNSTAQQHDNFNHETGEVLEDTIEIEFD
jgi:recombination protein RecT